MQVSTLIAAKANPEMPDYYGITIYYHSGKSEDFEVVSHSGLRGPQRLSWRSLQKRIL
jgi:hypothetical protein